MIAEYTCERPVISQSLILISLARRFAPVGGDLKMAGVAQDFRIALRQLRRSSGFTITAILTLTLGIGANTAIFSALNAMLLKMLPVRDPQQLYTVVLVNGGTQPPNTNGTGYGNTSFSYPVFEALRQKSNVLADLIAHIPLSYGKVPVRLGNTPVEKAGEEVSGNYFSGLGVPMALGRGLADAEEREHSPVTVISYRFWQEAFARDPGVIGKTFYIKGAPFTIVGVAAASFYGVSHSGAMDFWIPLQTRPELNAWEKLRPKFRGLGRRIGGRYLCWRGCIQVFPPIRRRISSNPPSGRRPARAPASSIPRFGPPIWALSLSVEFPALLTRIARHYRS